MAIVYKKSELGSFLEQLPSLLYQYRKAAEERAHDERMLERKIEHEEKLFQDKQEYEQSRIAYQDSREQYREVKNSLDALELEYEKSGGERSYLNEIYQTPGALEALDNITKPVAEDLGTQAQHLDSEIDYLEEKKDALSNVLYTDIAQAQEIMTGGAGFGGGFNKKEWDREDFGIAAYEKMYGPASDIVKSVFRAKPGFRETQYLQKISDTALASQRLARGEAYDEKTKAQKAKEDKETSNLWFGQRIRNSHELSGLQEIEGYDTTMALAVQNEDQELYDQAAESSINKTQQLGEFYGELIGEDEKTRKQNAMKNYEEFKNMHSLAKYQYTHGKGITVEPDFSLFTKLTDAAWKNYQSFSNETIEGQQQRERLDTIARALLGMSEEDTFEQFIQLNRMYYADNLLVDLIKSGHVENNIDLGEDELDFLDEFEFEEGDDE